jgi:hypothetical protein
MGLGLAYPDYGVPGVTTDRIAEQNQRGFYQRWAEFMEARSGRISACERLQRPDRFSNIPAVVCRSAPYEGPRTRSACQ